MVSGIPFGRAWRFPGRVGLNGRHGETTHTTPDPCPRRRGPARAWAAKADRDARLAAREARLTELLTDFYAAHAAATTVRDDARTRADAVVAEAHRRADAIKAAANEQAAAADTDVRAVVVAMAALGERPGAIAQLCRLRVPEVRALLSVGRRTPATQGTGAHRTGGLSDAPTPSVKGHPPGREDDHGEAPQAVPEVSDPRRSAA